MKNEGNSNYIAYSYTLKSHRTVIKYNELLHLWEYDNAPKLICRCILFTKVGLC